MFALHCRIDEKKLNSAHSILRYTYKNNNNDDNSIHSKCKNGTKENEKKTWTSFHPFSFLSFKRWSMPFSILLCSVFFLLCIKLQKIEIKKCHWRHSLILYKQNRWERKKIDKTMKLNKQSHQQKQQQRKQQCQTKWNEEFYVRKRKWERERWAQWAKALFRLKMRQQNGCWKLRAKINLYLCVSSYDEKSRQQLWMDFIHF